MHIISRARLLDFGATHPDAVAPLDAWYRIVKAATYRSATDVKAQFGTASFLSNNRVVFNVSGNKYRLVVGMQYPARVYIRHVLTHTDYGRLSNPDRL